ncbi:MAG: G1 family endopeptidase [Actinobacteria bacterium]|nr:G1 family endopeptidase [Actinomycetota bacterium]
MLLRRLGVALAGVVPLIALAAVGPVAGSSGSSGSLAVGATIAGQGAARTSALPETGALVPTQPGITLPERSGSVDSLNWSGYVATPPSGQRVTAVSVTYRVPSASLLPPGFAATWAGIGGYTSTDLIQAGTEQSSTGLLGAQYYAWYEVLPAASVQLTSGCYTADGAVSSCAVTPGDQMTVDIANQGGNQWLISITDAGNWTWSKTITYSSSESSAEWILEAPQIDGLQSLLADVGTVGFAPSDEYALDGGLLQPMADANPVQVILSPAGLIAEATPSAIDSAGTGFNDCSYQSSCPAP